MKENGLKPVLGLRECVFIGIGGMMGSAIFTLSGVTYGLAGPAALISWILGGVIVLLYALNVAELSSRFPDAGGLYTYPAQTLGSSETVRSFFGWLAAWSWINVTLVGFAFGAIFVAGYLGAFFPLLGSKVVLVAICSILFCLGLNLLGISKMGKAASLLTSILLFCVSLYVVMGAGGVSAANFQNFFSSGELGSKGLFAAIPIAMLAYSSIIALASLAEETKEPSKTIPRAIVLAMVITIIAYFIVLLVTYGNVSWQEFTPDSPAYNAPMHFAASQFAKDKPWVSMLVSGAAVLAIINSMLVLLMSTGRIIMGTAGNVLPEIFGKLTKNKVPGAALITSSLVAIMASMFPDFLMGIIGTGALCMGLMVLLITASLIAARRSQSDSQASYQIPGGLFVPIITMIMVVLNLTQLPKDSLFLGLWWYVLGIIIFALGKTWLRRTNLTG